MADAWEKLVMVGQPRRDKSSLERKRLNTASISLLPPLVATGVIGPAHLVGRRGDNLASNWWR